MLSHSFDPFEIEGKVKRIWKIILKMFLFVIVILTAFFALKWLQFVIYWLKPDEKFSKTVFKLLYFLKPHKIVIINNRLPNADGVGASGVDGVDGCDGGGGDVDETFLRRFQINFEYVSLTFSSQTEISYEIKWVQEQFENKDFVKATISMPLWLQNGNCRNNWIKKPHQLSVKFAKCRGSRR